MGRTLSYGEHVKRAGQPQAAPTLILGDEKRHERGDGHSVGYDLP